MRNISSARWVVAAVAMAASMSVGAAAPGRIQTLKVAGLAGDALYDGTIHMPNDGTSFVLGTPAKAAGVLSSHGLAADQFEFSIQVLLVESGSRVLLFDTGAGANLGKDCGYLPASLALTHVKPEQVTDIFISHAHGDHVGGLVTPDGRPAFPNAAIHLAHAEWDALNAMTDEGAKEVGIPNRSTLLAAMKPRVAPFEKNSTLIAGVVKAVDIAGHTPGHSAYLIGSGASSVLYSGDSFHHFVTSVTHPEWQIAFDGDKVLAAHSRVEIEPRWVGSQQILFAPHFPFPGQGTIVRDGQSYAWKPIGH